MFHWNFSNFLRGLKSDLFIIKDQLKQPGGLCRGFWLAAEEVFVKEIFFISLLMLCNFLPYLYQFASYGQYENAIGGLFKPFADILLAVMLIHLLPMKVQKYVKGILLALSFVAALTELFVIGKYNTFITAGIVSVIIGTNPREAAEFVSMYFSWQYILFLIAVGFGIYLIKRWSRCFKLNKFAALLLPFFFLYSFAYTVMPGKNIIECMSFTRLALPVGQAVEDLIAFRSIYDNMQNTAVITENESDIPNVVFILGESTTRNHMSLYGYRLPTTPKLDAMAASGEIYVFRDVISPHTYTIGSLEEVFNFHNYEADNKWYENSNLFDIVKKAGYTTYWLSNQETSGKWANVALAYADRCDYREFTGVRQSFEQSYRADGELLPLLYKYMANDNPKNFYLLHLMGGHGEYKNRYTPDFEKFTAADEDKGTASQRQLRAQYDNAMLYNDTIVSRIMAAFKDKNAIVIYMPDHGEEVYDVKNIKGHSDDNATRTMLEIPFIIYTTEKFRQSHPELNERIAAAVDRPYMTDDLIHTMLDILSIKTPEYDPSRSVINEDFNAQRRRMFLDEDYDLDMKAK